MLRTLAAQVHTLSAERGELLSGARDAYVAYIERLEAKLREREAAAVDQALVRSERQRLEVEASLAALEEKIVRTEQKEQGEAKRAAWRAGATSAKSLMSKMAAKGMTGAAEGGARKRSSAADLPPTERLNEAKEMISHMSIQEKLGLAAALQERMTPQELREALIDIIERLQAAQGDQLLATLKQAMTMLGPREKFAMLQAALGSLKGSEHDRFLETLQNGWYEAGGGGKAGTSKQVELTLGTYLLLPEQGRLAFLKAGVKEMGESEKAFLGLDRRTRSVAIMTVEAAQAAIEAAAAAEQAATDERARAEAAAAKQAEEKRKELMEQNKGAAAIQARIRGRSLRKSRSAPPPLFVPQGIPAAWAPLCRVVDKPVLLSAARLQGYISAIFEAKLVSDAACDREGRRRPPFTQLAHFTLQSTPPGQDRAAASHTLASMLVSAANYEALPGARPEGSLRVELFAIVAGMAGLGPLGPGKYSAHAATFFFDVLSAALFPPAEWKGLLALSEGGLSLPTTPIAGQRALGEAVQLIGLPLAFERKLHAELEASSEAEWGGAGRNVEVGRKVRVDVMLQKAMEMYFGQMAVSRLNWEHNFDAAVPVEPKILRSFSEFRTVLRQTIEDRPKTNKGQVGRLHDAGGGLAAIAKGLADKGSGPPEAELNISDEAVRELYLLAIERHDEMGKGEGKELRPDHVCRDAFVQVVVETGLQARDGGVVCSSRSLTNQLGQKARAAGGSGPAAAGGGGWAAAAAVATLGGKSGGSKKASLLQLARAAATVEDKQRSAAMTAFQKGL